MKLVDILAREMDEWPEYALAITQDQDCETWPCSDLDVTFSEGIWTSNGSFMIGGNILPSKTPASDYSTAIVTRAQWQAAVDALKAEKVVEWNCEGLPSVGTVCEYLGAHQYNEWSEVKIFGSWRNFVFVDFIDGWRQEDNPKRFRPIRTSEQIAAEEIQRIRDEIKWQKPKLGPCPVEQMYLLGYRKFEIVDN